MIDRLDRLDYLTTQSTRFVGHNGVCDMIFVTKTHSKYMSPLKSVSCLDCR